MNTSYCNRYQPDLNILLAITKIRQVNLKDLITDENNFNHQEIENDEQFYKK